MNETNKGENDSISPCRKRDAPLCVDGAGDPVRAGSEYLCRRRDPAGTPTGRLHERRGSHVCGNALVHRHVRGRRGSRESSVSKVTCGPVWTRENVIVIGWICIYSRTMVSDPCASPVVTLREPNARMSFGTHCPPPKRSGRVSWRNVPAKDENTIPLVSSPSVLRMRFLL